MYAAELDPQGTILCTNPALREGLPGELEGLPFELPASEQRAVFERRLSDLGEAWERATFGFSDGGGGAAEDRCLWLRRLPGGHVELVAEPAWSERDRLVEQVLQLNDGLIVTQAQRRPAPGYLERAQDQAASSEHRVRQLEAVLLAGLTPRNFDEALRSLLGIAQELLPGDRADILLLDDSGDRLVLRASAGPGAAPRDRRAVAVGGRFVGADLRLLELVGERVALAIGQAQLRDREQRMAETLQLALLPQSLPEVAGVELNARYLPHAASVGGDFYNALALRRRAPRRGHR